MTTPKDGPGPPPHSAEAEQAAFYETLSDFLRGLLMRAFEVPERDAEWLVRDTFSDYTLNKPAPDARAWLIGSACNKANDYRQRRGLAAANEALVARHAATALSSREAMEKLPRRAREALRLRFEEKKTYAEVAGELGISVYAAERFVAQALIRLRGVLRGEGTRQP
jgi:RNA polymerase sigma factor (sigma-70 family)